MDNSTANSSSHYGPAEWPKEPGEKVGRAGSLTLLTRPQGGFAKLRCQEGHIHNLHISPATYCPTCRRLQVGAEKGKGRVSREPLPECSSFLKLMEKHGVTPMTRGAE